MNNFFKIFKIEFKTQFVPGKLLVIIIFAFVPLINLIARNSSDFGNIEETWGRLGQMFTEVIMYSMISRLTSLVLVEKREIDKNRAEYLVFNKYKVLFAKIITDLMVFSITVIISAICGSLIVVYAKNGKIADTFAENVSVFIVGISLFYMIIAFMIRLILSLNYNSFKKILMIVLWMGFTLILYIILSIVIGVMKVGDKFPMREFYLDNIKWVSFIPFVNFGILAIVLYGMTADYYYLFPLIVQIIIVIIIFTKPLARNLKQYLCT